MSRTAILLKGLEGNGIGQNVMPLPARNDFLALNIELQSGTCLIGDFGIVDLYGNTEQLHHYNSGAELDGVNQYDKAGAYLGNNLLRLDMERLGIIEGSGFYGSTLKINPPANGNNQGDGRQVAKDVPAGTPVWTEGRLEFTVAATAINPKFRVWAEVEKNSDWTKGAGAVMRRKRFMETLAGTAEQGFSKWSFGNKKFRYIRRAFLALAGGTVNQVRVEADGKEIFNRTAALNSYIQSQYGYHTPGVGAWGYVVDFTENGRAEDFDTLGVGELTWNITGSAGGQLTALIEYGGEAW